MNQLLDQAHSLCAKGQKLDALTLCLPKAKDGDIACARLVGWIYSTGGVSVEKDTREAQRWLTVASDRGDALATYLLGTVLFERGESTAATKQFRKAGEKGVSAGLFQLGKMYELGSGVDKDEERAYECYRQSASMGHIFARRRVASMLIGGHRGAVGRLAGVPMLLVAIILGTRTAVADPYSERTFD